MGSSADLSGKPAAYPPAYPPRTPCSLSLVRPDVCIEQCFVADPVRFGVGLQFADPVRFGSRFQFGSRGPGRRSRAPSWGQRRSSRSRTTPEQDQVRPRSAPGTPIRADRFDEPVQVPDTDGYVTARTQSVQCSTPAGGASGHTGVPAHNRNHRVRQRRRRSGSTTGSVAPPSSSGPVTSTSSGPSAGSSNGSGAGTGHVREFSGGSNAAVVRQVRSSGSGAQLSVLAHRCWFFRAHLHRACCPESSGSAPSGNGRTSNSTSGVHCFRIRAHRIRATPSPTATPAAISAQSLGPVHLVPRHDGSRPARPGWVGGPRSHTAGRLSLMSRSAATHWRMLHALVGVLGGVAARSGCCGSCRHWSRGTQIASTRIRPDAGALSSGAGIAVQHRPRHSASVCEIEHSCGQRPPADIRSGVVGRGRTYSASARRLRTTRDVATRARPAVPRRPARPYLGSYARRRPLGATTRVTHRRRATCRRRTCAHRFHLRGACSARASPRCATTPGVVVRARWPTPGALTLTKLMSDRQRTSPACIAPSGDERADARCREPLAALLRRLHERGRVPLDRRVARRRSRSSPSTTAVSRWSTSAVTSN